MKQTTTTDNMSIKVPGELKKFQEGSSPCFSTTHALRSLILKIISARIKVQLNGFLSVKLSLPAQEFTVTHSPHI